MTVEDLENAIKNYINDETVYNHKGNALKEMDRIRDKVGLDEIKHIAFIVGDYPEYDHFLLTITGDGVFAKFGMSREYLKTLDDEGIHNVAEQIRESYGYLFYEEETR